VLVEVKVQSLALDRTTNTPVVILQELAGERVLPIWIGPGEASAIAMQLADMEFSRPLTHDLLCSVLKGLGGNLQKVIITRVEASTYYAEMIVKRNGEVFSLDARPSDSIAVALRVAARIFAQDDLLEEAAIEIAEEEPSAGEVLEGPRVEGMGPEELKEHLRKLNPEDFGRFTP
jgi:bifunctional DNase/RNase